MIFKGASKLTHFFAACFVAVAGFAVSPAGRALVSQYPKLAGLAGLVITLGALYRKPGN